MTPSSLDKSGTSAKQQAKSYDRPMQISITRITKLFQMLVKAAMIAFFLVAVGTYIFFCPPVLTTFNGGFILFPLPPGDEYKFDTINGVKREEVYFKNKIGDNLHGWFFQSPKLDAPVILISHGNAGNIGHRLLLVHHLMNAGASVLVYDYREFGKSEGKKSLNGLIDDAQAAYSYLTIERRIPSSQIILYGESIGNGPTCVLAKRHAVRGIILDSAFSNLLHIGKVKIPAFNIYPDFLQPIPAFDNTSALTEQHVPVLIIHGQQDEVLPVSEAHYNFEHASEPKTLVILPNSTHNCKDPDFDTYESAVRKFIESLPNKGSQNHA